MFLKALGAYAGPNDDVRRPRGSKKLDWEVELGIVIGERASYVPEHDAMQHVAGYCVVNDVSEREFQIERGGTWDKGKGCDTFGPTGPWLVTTDEVPDPHVLDLWVEVDGVRMQDGNTRTMIFNVPKIVSYASHFMTLHPGDIIATGTPARRRPGQEAGADLPAGRPDHAPGHPGPGRADATRGALRGLNGLMGLRAQECDDDGLRSILLCRVHWSQPASGAAAWR